MIQKGQKAGVYFARHEQHIATGSTQEEADERLKQKLQARGVIINNESNE
jgi:hypothetical protein